MQQEHGDSTEEKEEGGEGKRKDDGVQAGVAREGEEEEDKTGGEGESGEIKRNNKLKEKIIKRKVGKDIVQISLQSCQLSCKAVLSEDHQSYYDSS